MGSIPIRVAMKIITDKEYEALKALWIQVGRAQIASENATKVLNRRKKQQ